MIIEGSRYEGQPIIAIRGKDGVTRKLVEFRTQLRREDVRPGLTVHGYSRGEALDHITWEATGKTPGKEHLWWLLADVNQGTWPMFLTPGSDLLVPVEELHARRVP